VQTMETIKASDIVGGKFCVSSDDGQKLYETIKKALRNGKLVSISFENVADISCAFLDAARGQLYNGEFSEEELEEKLSLKDLSEEDLFY
jgi:hypothetical protein